MTEINPPMILGFVDTWAIYAGLPMLVFYLIFGIDDLFIDVSAILLKAKPQELPKNTLRYIHELPEKKIAILVASWKEQGVLEKMIVGNLASILYANYDFFIGVYPNDTETIQEATRLSATYPNVHLIVNYIKGPTSKGQMLNEVVRGIFAYERRAKIQYDGFLIHDSEDVIHPEALKLVNWQLVEFDFVQLPVFSLPVKKLAWTAGIYVDEFSEAHTKDLLVRNRLGCSIPSAGVGTGLSRKFVLLYLDRQNGNLLNQETLTEDYELGVSACQKELKSTYACFYTNAPGRQKNYIATREYFPRSFGSSIKQKTRWTLGIAFQGTDHLGWKGSLLHKYFLYRDRKGTVSNIVVLIGGLDFFYLYLRPIQISYELINYALITTLCFMVNRIVQRCYCVKRVYGMRSAFFAPLRMPLANLINGLASTRACFQFIRSKIENVDPAWIKTQHELPQGFGNIGLTRSIPIPLSAVSTPDMNDQPSEIQAR